MTEENELIQVRRKKLEDLRALGVNPYGQRYEATDHAEELHAKYGETAKEELEANKVAVKAAGRIVAFRSFGKAAFAHIQDVTGKVQVYMKRDVLGEEQFALMNLLDVGDYIGVEGFLFVCRAMGRLSRERPVAPGSRAARPQPPPRRGTRGRSRLRRRRRGFPSPLRGGARYEKSSYGPAVAS